MEPTWTIWVMTDPASKPLGNGACAARLSRLNCPKPISASLPRSLGLSNWDKPAAACLSSRIPRGIVITSEQLSRVEGAEAVLHR